MRVRFDHTDSGLCIVISSWQKAYVATTLPSLQHFCQLNGAVSNADMGTCGTSSRCYMRISLDTRALNNSQPRP